MSVLPNTGARPSFLDAKGALASPLLHASGPQVLVCKHAEHGPDSSPRPPPPRIPGQVCFFKTPQGQADGKQQWAEMVVSFISHQMSTSHDEHL